MTVYNWSSMTPRERDALVAEKVMGWTDFSPINPDVDYEVGINGHRRNFAFPPDGKYQPIPNYTTDISAAWEVVEKLDADGWRFDLSTHQSRTTSVGVDFERKNDGCYVDATAPTAPEAICLAALKAVGVEIQ